MTNVLPILIRDGVPEDIPHCVGLNHTYETARVWQVNLQATPEQWQITLREGRLPYPIQLESPANDRRLRYTLLSDACFLVATLTPEAPPVAYLALQPTIAQPTATIIDCAVDVAYRRQAVATRLLQVAERWATRHSLEQLWAEAQPKNAPAIAFYQQAGYTFCGYHDTYFPNKEIALFFSKTLR
ncbi:MAG: GNAT family N-acetyltransferase [Phototrophicaceae bacterium]|jgi:ribosomal protein S18 acetylase RimI-like enzyme